MSRHHYYHRIQHPYLGFISRLDLELLISGFSTEITEWPEHVQAVGDPFWRIYLPVKGDFRLQYTYEEYAIVPDNLYLIPPYAPFLVRSITPSTHYWIHFFSDELGHIQGLGEPFRLPVATGTLRPLFREIVRGFSFARTISEVFEVKHKVISVLTILLEKLADGHGLRFSSDRFSHITDYIDNNLERPLEIAELRAMTSLSGPEFSAQFRRAMGVPPKQYLSIRRISKAKMLLLRTQDPIKEIALRTGFENEFFFFRIFKKYTGLTPTQYRAKNLPE